MSNSDGEPSPPPADPFAWLEEIDGVRALQWVAAHNEISSARFAREPEFEKLRGRILAVLDSPDRIPYIRKMGSRVYNFWRDAQHPRGIWRRTNWDEYRRPDPHWETVLDLDALAQAEGESWVWGGAECRYPDWERCLVHLSRGGGDAFVVREFDLETRQFVDGGFALPEAKTSIQWLDRDRVFVGTDEGPGSLTDSGYPRRVKIWQRGTPISAARTVFEASSTDISASGYVSERRGYRRPIVQQSMTFYTARYWLHGDGGLESIAVPEDAEIGFFSAFLLVQLRSEWDCDATVHPAGSLLAIEFERFQRGNREFDSLFAPSAERALGGYATTRNFVLLNILDKVRSRIVEQHRVDGQWLQREVQVPPFGSLGIAALDRDESDAYLLTHVDFLTPDSLVLARAGEDECNALKQRPAFFDAQGMTIRQHEAVSADGTKIPYFVVEPRAMRPDGDNPALLNGYGGFEVSLTPSYSATIGMAWLAKGGVYVLANIRGGGEFGPRWHEAARRQGREKSFEDFAAVADDLVLRGITRRARLGIMGGSNGGLLVGVMATRWPERFGAVVCQVPLLDMRRYHRLLAGASWMAEYGNPDEPDDWSFLQRYSPYENLRPGVRHPQMLFTTSTRDDRVHPGHARKMVAKMEEAGIGGVWYYENTEGGHAGASDNRQSAFLAALEFRFLREALAEERGEGSSIAPAPQAPETPARKA